MFVIKEPRIINGTLLPAGPFGRVLENLTCSRRRSTLVQYQIRWFQTSWQSGKAGGRNSQTKTAVSYTHGRNNERSSKNKPRFARSIRFELVCRTSPKVIFKRLPFPKSMPDICSWRSLACLQWLNDNVA